MNRRLFLQRSATGAAGIILFPSIVMAQQNDKGPALSAELVKEFVGKAHKDKDKVIDLLKETPTLLNAAWDHGGGDFETALGAASHVGYIELVNHLIENGAQVNFLTLCLLGKTEIVKAMLKDQPKLINMKGPHGFTPLHHANNGGDNAREVKEYLESLGAKETKVKLIYPPVKKD